MNVAARTLARKPLPMFRAPRPLVSIGDVADASAMPMPVVPSRTTLFAPRGLCLVEEGGPLWVSDSGHHRVLGWAQAAADREADWVIGQTDFVTERPNAGRDVDGATLRVPTGICRYRDGLAVADSWNHRVLLWERPPHDMNVPADRVLGQPDKCSAEPNAGRPHPSGGSLHWPYGVAADGDRLFVADTGNRRVLIWNNVPGADGAPADVVLGQTDFLSRDLDNGRVHPGALMRWPHAMTIVGGALCVADAGLHRILIWQHIPAENAAEPHAMLGQTAARAADANGGAQGPTATGFNMPYAIAACGDFFIVADTCNSRLMAWPLADITKATEAIGLWGQVDFRSRGDNAWQPVGPQTLSWPYGLSACGNRVAIADTGNNRVQMWELGL